MPVMIKVSVGDLRKAFMPGVRKVGTVKCDFTYDLKPVTALQFDRNNIVRYRNSSGEILAVYQDMAHLDD